MKPCTLLDCVIPLITKIGQVKEIDKKKKIMIDFTSVDFKNCPKNNFY